MGINPLLEDIKKDVAGATSNSLLDDINADLAVAQKKAKAKPAKNPLIDDINSDLSAGATGWAGSESGTGYWTGGLKGAPASLLEHLRSAKKAVADATAARDAVGLEGAKKLLAGAEEAIRTGQWGQDEAHRKEMDRQAAGASAQALVNARRQDESMWRVDQVIQKASAGMVESAWKDWMQPVLSHYSDTFKDGGTGAQIAAPVVKTAASLINPVSWADFAIQGGMHGDQVVTGMAHSISKIWDTDAPLEERVQGAIDLVLNLVMLKHGAVKGYESMTKAMRERMKPEDVQANAEAAERVLSRAPQTADVVRARQELRNLGYAEAPATSPVLASGDVGGTPWQIRPSEGTLAKSDRLSPLPSKDPLGLGKLGLLGEQQVRDVNTAHHARAQAWAAETGRTVDEFYKEFPVAFESDRMTGDRKTSEGALAQDGGKVDTLGFFSKLERVLEEKVANRAPASQVLKTMEAAGVKAEELQYTGMRELLESRGDKPVTKAELLKHFEENAVSLSEVVRGGEADRAKAQRDGIPDTKFDAYRLPGGKNYREMVLKLNGSDFVANAGHFDVPGALAHIRFDERTGPKGEKVLHVAEIQSDWHQRGRDKGYKSGQALDMAELERRGEDLRSQIREAQDPAERARLTEMLRENGRLASEQLSDAHRVPDAPFKKNWHEMAMRRVIRYASENGFDRVSWDTGSTIADRFDISKEVSRIEWDQERGVVRGFDHSGKRVIDRTNLTESDLPDLIGKEAAQKLLDQEVGHGGVRSLEGEQLKVGGEGMKGFYDKILPDYANKLGKRYGVKVQPGEISWDTTRQPINEPGSPFHGEMEHVPGRTAVPTHSLEITPAMREAVLKEGQPLFQGTKDGPKAVVDFVDLPGGVQKAIIRLFEGKADVTSVIHELGHVWRRTLTGEDARIIDRWLGIPEGKTWEEFRKASPEKWRAAEERFARAVERYFMKGEAPSAALKGVFVRMREWFVSVYHSLKVAKQLDVGKMSPDVRDVFDRMFDESRAVKPRPSERASTRATIEELAKIDPEDPRLDPYGKFYDEHLADQVAEILGGEHGWANVPPAQVLRDLREVQDRHYEDGVLADGADHDIRQEVKEALDREGKGGDHVRWYWRSDKKGWYPDYRKKARVGALHASDFPEHVQRAFEDFVSSGWSDPDYRVMPYERSRAQSAGASRLEGSKTMSEWALQEQHSGVDADYQSNKNLYPVPMLKAFLNTLSEDYKPESATAMVRELQDSYARKFGDDTHTPEPQRPAKATELDKAAESERAARFREKEAADKARSEEERQRRIDAGEETFLERQTRQAEERLRARQNGEKSTLADESGVPASRGDRAGREPEYIPADSLEQKDRQTPAMFSSDETGGRFASTRLSPKEKQEIVASIKDAYRENGLQRSRIRDGVSQQEYEYRPDLFVRSDVTGALMRYYVELPDGRKAHPTEVYHNFPKVEIEKAIRERFMREGKKADTAPGEGTVGRSVMGDKAVGPVQDRLFQDERSTLSPEDFQDHAWMVARWIDQGLSGAQAKERLARKFGVWGDDNRGVIRMARNLLNMAKATEQGELAAPRIVELREQGLNFKEISDVLTQEFPELQRGRQKAAWRTALIDAGYEPSDAAIRRNQRRTYVEKVMDGPLKDDVIKWHNDGLVLHEISDRLSEKYPELAKSKHEEAFARAMAMSDTPVATKINPKGDVKVYAAGKAVTVPADVVPDMKSMVALKVKYQAFKTPGRLVDQLSGFNQSLRQWLTTNREKATTRMAGERSDWRARLAEQLPIDVNDKEASALTMKFGEGVIGLDDLKEARPNDWQKIVQADEWFRGAYDELLDRANAVLAKFGQETVPKRANYYTHMADDASFFESILGNRDTGRGGVLSEVAKMAEVRESAGRRNTPFNKFFQQRVGNKTRYDAVANFEAYLQPTLATIHMTKPAMRARALSKVLSDAAMDLGKESKWWESADDFKKAATAAAQFAHLLTEHANLLVGQGHSLDKTALAGAARIHPLLPSAVRGLGWIVGRVGSNAVVGNFRTAIMQVGSLPQAATELGWSNLGAAAIENANSFFHVGDAPHGEVLSKSLFLKRRYADTGTARDTFGGKVSEVISYPAELVEQNVAEMIWRAAYDKAQSTSALRGGLGFTETEAIQYADRLTQDMVTGRGKGEKPLFFENILGRTLGQFQIEQGQFLQHLGDGFKYEGGVNTGRLLTKPELALKTTRLAVNLMVVNSVMQQIFNDNPLPDPLRLLWDLVELERSSDPMSKKLLKAAGRVSGEGLSAVPGGAVLAGAVPEKDVLGSGLSRRDVLGKSEAGRYAGSITSAGALGQLFFGPRRLAAAVYQFAFPYGGGQVSKTVRGIDAITGGGLVSRLNPETMVGQQVGGLVDSGSKKAITLTGSEKPATIGKKVAESHVYKPAGFVDQGRALLFGGSATSAAADARTKKEFPRPDAAKIRREAAKQKRYIP